VVEVGDQSEQALEAAAARCGQRQLAQVGTSCGPEQLSPFVLDSLAGEQGMDAVLERGAQAGERDVVARQLSQLSQLAGRDVGLGQEIGAQQVSERACIDGIRLHPCGRDHLRVPRISEVELDPLALEQVRQPLPAEAGLERDLRFLSSSAKMARSATGSFVTRRESSSRPSSSKAATCEVLRCRSIPT
jgi:hypothetical protein